MLRAKNEHENTEPAGKTVCLWISVLVRPVNRERTTEARDSGSTEIKEKGEQITVKLGQKAAEVQQKRTTEEDNVEQIVQTQSQTMMEIHRKITEVQRRRVQGKLKKQKQLQMKQRTQKVVKC